MATHLIGITEARDRFKDLIEEVGDHAVTILRRNKPVAMLIDPDRLERLYDKIENLEDEIAMLRSKYESEGVVSQEDVEREFLREHEKV